MSLDEGGVVDKDEEGHEDLAVESVGEASVTGNDGAKVFDLEGAFEAGSEETAERGDESREDGERKRVQLERVTEREREVDIGE